MLPSLRSAGPTEMRGQKKGGTTLPGVFWIHEVLGGSEFLKSIPG